MKIDFDTANIYVCPLHNSFEVWCSVIVVTEYAGRRGLDMISVCTCTQVQDCMTFIHAPHS